MTRPNELTCVVDDAIWTHDQTLRISGGLTLPIRMSVIRLPDASLLLHSPTPISDELGAALTHLGPVRHIVAPSLLHHLYAHDASKRFPNATLWAAPGLAAKRADVPWSQTLDPDHPPAVWGGALDMTLVRGAPSVNELTFFHGATQTLLVTDLFFHITQPADLLSAALLTLTGTRGRLAMSRAWRFAFIKDRAQAAESVRAILSQPIERLIPCHGDIIEAGARERLLPLARWLTH
jgi:hypothetical protein